MGILDDAIREHLELKRQHGAGDEDLERLENEAFGPAARPGDPEFATGEEPVPDAPTGDEAAVEAPAELEASAPAEPVSEELAVAEPPSEEQPAETPAEESPSGSFGIFDAESEFGESEETPAERARVEYADLDDTADHPAPTQLGPVDEAEPVPSEPAPSAEAPAAADETELDVTEAIEPEAAAAPAAEEAAAPEAPEADIFSEDEDFGLSDMDLSIEEDEPSSGAAAPPAGDAGAGDGEGEDADGEDLLEETPDFLQESEGEDLWFEQGPPRDFDFDDD